MLQDEAVAAGDRDHVCETSVKAASPQSPCQGKRSAGKLTKLKVFCNLVRWPAVQPAGRL